MKLRCLLSSGMLCLLASAIPDAAFAQIAPRTPHRALPVIDYTGHQIARIVVKFHDDSGIRAIDGTAQFNPGEAVLSAPALRKELIELNRMVATAGLRVDPLFEGRDKEFAVTRERATAAWQRKTADLPTYLQVAVPRKLSHKTIQSLVARLSSFSAVEVAYAEPVAFPMDFPLSQAPESGGTCANEPLDPVVGDLTELQGYLYAAPAGINVAEAHATPGGHGEGVRVIDIEGGYGRHSDHPQQISLVGETSKYYREHGTAVVGVVAAKDNGIGMTGIAHAVNMGFRSVWNNEQFDDWGDANSNSANVANHIYWGAKHSLQGIVLIELQRPGPKEEDCPCGTSCSAAPVEYWPAEFDAIQTAVGNGAVVVEAAGNGARSLDHPVFEQLFDREVRDSGAILVSASASDGITPKCGGTGPNFGTRIDLHAWGENVATTGSAGGKLFPELHFCTNYTVGFSGSSSASAIVAGAAASLQGIHRNLTGEPMAPADLVELMVSTGTPQAQGTEDSQPIGPQPNIGDAAHLLLKMNSP